MVLGTVRAFIYSTVRSTPALQITKNRLLPVCQTSPLSDKLCPLDWLGQQVCMHVCWSQMLDYHFTMYNFLTDPEVTNVDVTGALGSWSTSLHKCHTAEVILIDNSWSYFISLCDNKVPEMNCLTGST